ncbi:MAG: lamin tail domain-containing protein [Polyangiaceae bacterium]
MPTQIGFELYNGSDEAISLSGFHLTDSVDDPTKSSMDASLTIKAGGVLLLWADGDRDEQGALHTTFSLSAAGEGVFLFDASGKLVDSTTWTNAAADATFARLPDGTGAFAWCASGTPNRTNGASCKTSI